MVKKTRSVSLNIKDQKADCLAEALAADVRALAKRASARVKRPYLHHAEYLYDKHGLPKSTS